MLAKQAFGEIVMTNRQLLKKKVARLNEDEVKEVLEYISIMEAMRGQALDPSSYAPTSSTVEINAHRAKSTQSANN